MKDTNINIGDLKKDTNIKDGDPKRIYNLLCLIVGYILGQFVDLETLLRLLNIN